MPAQKHPPGEAVADEREDFFSSSFRRLLDNFLDGSLQPRFCPAERYWSPPTDIFETADAILIKMELAGVRDEDVDVKVSDNYLVVRGRRMDERNIKKENFHLMEIQYGRFERAFRLPEWMHVTDVSAALKNGFLVITVPKDPQKREYRIQVE